MKNLDLEIYGNKFTLDGERVDPSMVKVEHKTYVWCGNCQCHFSEYFAKFRRCPICGGGLNVLSMTGLNLPDVLPTELRLAKSEE